MNSQKGFTLPELLIVMSVSAVLLTLVTAFTISFSRFASSLQLVNDSLVSRLNISDYFREKLGASSGMITQNSIADASPGNVDVSISPANYWVKLHATPGNIAMGSSGAITPVFYFKRYSQTSTNAIIMNGVNPYEDEYILYMRNADKSLYMRTLANQSASGNKAITTCAPESTTPTCPSDAKLIDNVASVDVRYFSRSGNLIDWTSVYDSTLGTYVGPDFPLVEVVELKVNTTTAAKFQSNILNNTTVIRVAIRNT